MTDKPSGLAAAFADLGAAIEDGLDTLGEALAGQVPYTAGTALNALLDDDEDTARQALDRLNLADLDKTARAAQRLADLATDLEGRQQ